MRVSGASACQMLTTDRSDRRRWLQVWEETGREPFAHPDFADLFSEAGSQPIALVSTEHAITTLIPLTIRSIPGSHPTRYDAISPYGYGGPFYSGNRTAPCVLSKVKSWMRANGIVSCFMRLSLNDLHAGEFGSGIRVREIAPNVRLDLRPAKEDIWSQYDRKVRKNVNKSRRAGCQVERDAGPDNAFRFHRIYTATMNRRRAAERYSYDESFFEELFARLQGQYFIYYVVNPDGETISAELVLHSDRQLYSFLGGTLAEYFPIAPNDLLKHEVAMHGHANGYESYVLGGGYLPGDGIFRYKRSFAPTGVLPFHVAEIIADQETYSVLCAQRGQLSQPFFPAYRQA